MKAMLLSLFLCLFVSYNAFGKCGDKEVEELIAAIKADDLEMVLELEKLCDLKKVKYTVEGIEYGLFHLAAAYAKPGILQFLLNHQFAVNDQDNYLKLTPLHLAVAKINIEAVAFLIEHGADQTLLTLPLDSWDGASGLTPLEYLGKRLKLNQIFPQACEIEDLKKALAGIYPTVSLPFFCVIF